jgi:N-acyl-D-aspartate/D-glutamate deacylase
MDEESPADRAILDQAVLYPDVAIATDAAPFLLDNKMVEGDVWPVPDGAYTNPRAVGSYARILGRYVREGKKMSLMEVIRRATLIPAQIIEEAVRDAKHMGRLQEGAFADVVVFDPNTIIDRATYQNPRQPSEGVRYLVVHGQFVIRDRMLIRDAFPGRPVRGPMRSAQVTAQ